MTESIEYKGDWKLPNQDEWIKGTLTYSPDNGALLEIHGTFNVGFSDKKPQDIILGKTNGGILTLINCHYQTTQTRLDTKITIGKYRPRYIITGKQFDKLEDIEFTNVVFTLFNLFEWFNTTGMNSSLNAKDVNLKYNRPERIGPLRCNKECSLTVDFSYQVETGAENRQFRIMEDVKGTLEYNVPKHFESIIQDIHTFENFVTVAVFEQSYPLSISFMDGKESYQCFYSSTGYHSKHSFRHNALHILQYEAIKEDFPQLLMNWFQTNSKIKPVFNLLLYAFRDKLRISEDKFMDLCRALEIFHRQIINSTPYPEDEFNHRFTRTVYNSFERDQAWLSRQLKFANVHNLEARLNDLYKQYAPNYIVDRVDNKNEFITRVVATRNYYTHYNPALEPKAYKKDELYHPTKMLIALLIACIYQYLGVKKESFEDNMNDSTI